MQLNWSLKKLLTSSALALLVATSAHAIPRGPCEPVPKDTCCEEPKPGPFAFSYPKDMNLACPQDFYFRADYLFMQPKEDGLEFAVRDDNGVANNSLSGGEVIGFSTGNSNWDWGSGARVGMGFYLNHDAWSIDLQWTWFKINEESSATMPNNGVFIPQFLVGDDSPPLAGDAHSSARWHMVMNTIDVSIGKPYHVSRYLVLSPFFGLRGASIDQNFTARYGGTWTSDSVDGAKMNGENDFWGIGIRGGVNSEWNVGGGWQLHGNINSSMLYGKFDVSQNCPLGTNNTYTIQRKFYRDNVNMELQAGVSWGTHFNEMKHYVKVQVMWEFQQWWDQNWMRKIYHGGDEWINETLARGDLSLSGVSGRIAFDF